MALAEQANDKISVGGVYTGKVLKLKPFGAIVSLPKGPPGLVHISQIANGFIQSVADVLSVGDEVDVRVITYDPNNGKISLSMKDVPQSSGDYDYDEGEEDDYNYRYDTPVVISAAQAANFEEQFKSWQKLSNERIAGINKRNKRGKKR